MDFEKLFIHDLDWGFALEICIRTLIMFTVILVFLRMSGKKGIRQLSIFEVAIVIGMGSAAGDPMFNDQIAILPAVVVFSTILLFYRGITWLAARSGRFEDLLEGKPLYVIEDGRFVLHGDHTGYAEDEFFAEMRQQSIEHVGQVKTAILETNGVLSFYYYPDDEVRPGLPVLPKVFQRKSETVEQAGAQACTRCAAVFELAAGRHRCERCGGQEWVEAIDSTRVT